MHSKKRCKTVSVSFLQNVQDSERSFYFFLGTHLLGKLYASFYYIHFVINTVFISVQVNLQFIFPQCSFQKYLF